jgi:predicted Zn-dependent protease
MRTSTLCTRLVVLAGIALGAILPATGCTTNPTTGRKQFLGLSKSEEIQIGMTGKPEMLKEYGGEVAKAELRTYVTEVGVKLASTVGQDDPSMSDLPWEFSLLNSDVANAFALPGGKVFMSRGLAQKMTNEAQLAAVLGHEIGHVTARHTSERYGQALGAQAGLGVFSVLLGSSGVQGGADIANSAGQIAGLALLKYSRDQESEADSLGMRYMTRIGYNPRGAYEVMQILASLSPGRQSSITDTHPDPAKRARDVEREIGEKYAFTQNNTQYRMGDQEFKTRFLSKLAAAYPEAGATRLASKDDMSQIHAGIQSIRVATVAAGSLRAADLLPQTNYLAPLAFGGKFSHGQTVPGLGHSSAWCGFCASID